MEKERNQYTDEQLEALLVRHLRKNDPNIRCPQRKKNTKICVHLKCGNTLKCSDVRCQSCGKDVYVGCIVNCNLKKITETVNERIGGQRWILGKILRFEEQFISNTRKAIKQFIGECLTGAGTGEHAEQMGKTNEKRYNDLSSAEEVIADW